MRYPLLDQTEQRVSGVKPSSCNQHKEVEMLDINLPHPDCIKTQNQSFILMLPKTHFYVFLHLREVARSWSMFA